MRVMHTARRVPNWDLRDRMSEFSHSVRIETSLLMWCYRMNTSHSLLCYQFISYQRLEFRGKFPWVIKSNVSNRDFMRVDQLGIGPQSPLKKNTSNKNNLNPCQLVGPKCKCPENLRFSANPWETRKAQKVSKKNPEYLNITGSILICVVVTLATPVNHNYLSYLGNHNCEL